MITKTLLRFKYAISGIWHALSTDFSYQVQVFGGGIALGVFGYFFWPLSQTEILFLGLAWTLILITELQNSSFEAALDLLHPELHEEIGKSKDMAAGAVLTAGFFLVFVMAMIAIL
jgi:diacylglycerol kinase